MKLKIKPTKSEKNLFLMIIALIIFLLGVTGNFLAVTENECKMPFQIGENEYSYETSEHQSFYLKEEVNYYHFTDIIYLGRTIVLIGDILMIIGIILIIISSIGFTLIKRKEAKKLREELK